MSDERKPEGIRARDAAMQLPSIVAGAFLSRAIAVHGVTLQPFSWDTMLVLHQIGNSVARGGAVDGLKPIEIAQLIFAFAAPDDAIELAAEPDELGAWSDFDKAALRFLRAHGITPGMLPEISEAIGKLIQEGLAAAPGAGAENPPPGRP